MGADAERILGQRAFGNLVADTDYLLLIDADASDAARAAWRSEVTRVAVLDTDRTKASRAGVAESAEVRPARVMAPDERSDRRLTAFPVCRLRLGSWALRRDPDQLDADTRAEVCRLARWITDRSVGVALGGGGAWGYCHVALLEALDDRNIPIDVVSGVSFGAMAGAYYCHSGRDGLDRLVKAGDRFQWMLPAAVVTADIIGWQVRHDLGDAWLDDLIPIFLPVATDIATGRTVPIRGRTLDWGVRASGSFPTVFAPTIGPDPVAERWRRFVDGGISDNVPEAALIEAGIDLVVASNIVPGPPPRDVKPAGRAENLELFLRGLNPFGRFSDAWRSMFTLFHSVGDATSFGADVLYDAEPRDSLPTQFHRAEHILGNARPGAEKAADEVLKRYRAMAPRLYNPRDG